MPYTPKNERLDIANLLQDFSQTLDELNKQDSGLILSITDFYSKVINLGNEFKLTQAQLLILKLSYGLDISDDDLAILQAWLALDKTTWNHKKKKSPQVVVLEAGRRSGKCRSLNSIHFSQEFGMVYGYEILAKLIIPNQNLSLVTENEVKQVAINNNLLDVSLDYKESIAIEGINKTAQTKSFYVNGNSKTKIITTFSGYSLEATPEHRVKVLTLNGSIEWVYLKDIKEGDFICIHKSTFIFPTKYLLLNDYFEKDIDITKKFDSKYSYLIGLIIAKALGKKTRLILSYRSLYFKILYNSLKECIEILGLKSVQISMSRKKIIYPSKLMLNFLLSVGVQLGECLTDRNTPLAIRQSPKDVQAAYLSGLFDANALVEKRGRDITLLLTSNKLVKETQLLLLNFGIVSFIEDTRNFKTISYYCLVIKDIKNLEIFIKEIGFKLNCKQNLVLRNLQVNKKNKYNETEKIPLQKSWFRRLKQSIPFYLFNDDKMFFYPNLNDIISFDESNSVEDLDVINHFKNLKDCNYYYDPVVKVEDSESFCFDLTVPNFEQYVAQGMTNHNTTCASIIGAYEFYCMCMLENPQSHYGLAQSTPIEILILATTASQAKTSIFRQVGMLLKTSAYFNKLIDKGLLFIGKEEIAYEAKGLYIKSGNSKSSSQVGGTIKCMIMDEVARFADSNGVSNAMELWSNLGISCAPFKDKAKRVAISSAWEENDAIFQLYKSTENSIYSLGLRLASWELNNNISRDNPIVAYEYDKDPIAASLEFEGIRPTIQSAYLDSFSIDKALTGESVISANPIIENNLVKLDVFYCEPRLFRDTVLHIDPGVVKDAYSLAFAHPEFDKDNKLIVVVDGLLAWQPGYSNEVCMSDVGEKIRYINQLRPLLSVTADHYNSTETIQRLKQDGIPSEIVYFSNKTQFMMYSVVRSLLNEGRLILPKDSLWTALVVRELKRVQMLKDKKIDHPPSESKDLADAVAAIAYKLNEKAGFLHNPLSNIIIAKEPPVTNNFIDKNFNSNDFRKTVLSKLSQRRTWAKNSLKR